MKFLKNSYRCLFLFSMLFAFSSLYSDESEQLYDDEIELCDEEIENVEVGQHALKEYHVSDKSKKKKAKLSYFLYTEDFIKSFIEVPTSNVASDSTTVSSRYLAGRAPVYNLKGEKVGICSASFLCMQNQENIFTDISNYLSIDNGLIVTWFTPTTLINLELDSILNSMVTECIVTASTKVGVNPFYGKKYNMIVSSDQSKIYFKLHKL